MAVETLISVEQFFDLPVNEGVQRELIHGRLIEMPAPAFPHAAIQLEIGWLLRNIVAERFPHLIVATHSGFIVGTGSAQAPDVFLIDRDRVQAMPSHRGALRGAPDLAVEIISPNESAADVDEKVELYLAAGTRTVWLVWPNTKHVLIYHRSGEVRQAGLGQTIDAPEVLPDVAIPVASLFPVL